MSGRQRALVLADNDYTCMADNERLFLADNDSLYCEVSPGSNLNDDSNWIEPSSSLAVVVVSVGACLSVLLSLPSGASISCKV